MLLVLDNNFLYIEKKKSTLLANRTLCESGGKGEIRKNKKKILTPLYILKLGFYVEHIDYLA